LKTVARISARIPEKIQNLEKWVQSLCAPLRPFRSEFKEKFYHSIYPMYCKYVHPYKNILLPRYRVPQKSVKLVQVVPKMEGNATICAHRIAIKPCIFLMSRRLLLLLKQI